MWVRLAAILLLANVALCEHKAHHHSTIAPRVEHAKKHTAQHHAKGLRLEDLSTQQLAHFLDRSLEDVYSMEEIEMKNQTGRRLSVINSADRELEYAAFRLYRTFLRLRRYMYICPKNLDAGSHFISRTRDNTIRLIRLGIDIATIGAGGSGLSDEVLGLLGVDSEVAEKIYHSIGFLDEVADFTGEHIRQFIEGHRHDMWIRRGKYADPAGFTDVTLNDVYQVLMIMLAHRSVEGEWNVPEVDATFELAKTEGSFRAADQIEEVVSHPAVKGVGIGYFIVATILTAIPVTAPAGGVMLAVGAGIGVASSVTSLTVVNYSGSTKHAHILSILIKFWRWEMRRGCIDERADPAFPLQLCPQQVCSIVGSDDKTCGPNRVCLRELLFSLTGEEGKLDLEFEKDGYCSRTEYDINPGLSALNLGQHCNLHRDCLSGYCHFGITSWNSENMWDEFLARRARDPESSLADIPEKIRATFLDNGICAEAVAMSATDDTVCSVRGHKLIKISKKHKFKACVPPVYASDKTEFNGLPEVVVGDRRVYYNTAVTMFTAVPHGAEGNHNHRSVAYYMRVDEDNSEKGKMTLKYSANSLRFTSEGKDPISLETYPWQIAQRCAFVGPLKCSGDWKSKPDYGCKGEYYLSSVRYGDTLVRDTPMSVRQGEFVMLVCERPTAKARDGTTEPTIDKFGFLYYDKFLIGTNDAAVKDVRFSLEPRTKRMYVPPEVVFQMRATRASEYTLPVNRATSPSLRYSERMSLVPALDFERQLCLENFKPGGKQPFRSECTNEKSLRDQPYIGTAWNPNPAAPLMVETVAKRGYTTEPTVRG